MPSACRRKCSTIEMRRNGVIDMMIAGSSVSSVIRMMICIGVPSSLTVGIRLVGGREVAARPGENRNVAVITGRPLPASAPKWARSPPEWTCRPAG